MAADLPSECCWPSKETCPSVPKCIQCELLRHRCLCIALALRARLEAINDVSVWCPKLRLQKSQEFLSSLGAHGLRCFSAPVKGSIQACADRWTGLKAGSQGRCVRSWALCFSLLCLLTLPHSGSQPCKYTHQPKSVLQATSLPNLPKIYVPKSHLSVLNKGCLWSSLLRNNVKNV